MSDAHEEIKRRLDIVEFITEYVALKRAGQNFRGLCPFHAEKTPSFMVSPAKQRYHCFGCGASGDIFGFVESHDNLSPSEALKSLAQKAGVTLKHSGERGIREQLIALHRDAVGFYAGGLEKSASAKDYLTGRGLTAGTIAAFFVGYAPTGWHGLFLNLKGKGYAEAVIKQSGLVSYGVKGPYDVFRERIMFPITNSQGEVIAFGGRAMGEAMPKYLNSPDTPLFKKSATLYALDKAKEEIRKTKEAVIVEGYMDALMCHQHGMKNAIAPLGTALTESHVAELVRRFDCSITMLFDGDKAGKSAARRSLELVLNMDADVRVSFLLLPEGEDPASLLFTKGGEHLQGLMSGAGSMVDFMLKTSDRSKGNAAAIGETLSLIDKVNDPVRKDGLILELAEKTGIRESSLRERLVRTAKRGDKMTAGASRPRNGNIEILSDEMLLLSAMIHLPEKRDAILKNIEPADLQDAAIAGLFVRLASSGPAEPASVAETDGEIALINRFMFQPGFDLSTADKTVEDCLKRLSLRRLDAGIKEAERAGDLKRLDGLVKERARIIKEV